MSTLLNSKRKVFGVEKVEDELTSRSTSPPCHSHTLFVQSNVLLRLIWISSFPCPCVQGTRLQFERDQLLQSKSVLGKLVVVLAPKFDGPITFRKRKLLFGWSEIVIPTYNFYVLVLNSKNIYRLFYTYYHISWDNLFTLKLETFCGN